MSKQKETILKCLPILLLLAISLGMTRIGTAQDTKARLHAQLGDPFLYSVAVTSDGRYLVTGSGLGAQLWEVETGREVRRFEWDSGGARSSWSSQSGLKMGPPMALSSDGRYLVMGNVLNKLVRVWELETGREVRRFEESSSVFSVALTQDGRYLLTGCRGTARLWDVETGREVRRFEGLGGDIDLLAVTPDGRYLLTGSWDTPARLWEIATGREAQGFMGHPNMVFPVAMTPDGRYFITGSDNNTVRLWELATGHEIRRFEGHLKKVSSIAVTPDGKFVATGSLDNTVRLWEIATGREVQRFESHVNPVSSIAGTPDGKYLVTGSIDGARMWELATGRETRRFEGRSIDVASVNLSHNGKYIVLRSGKQAVLWSLEVGAEERRFAGNIGTVSPDGRYVTTQGDKNTVRLWERATGREVQRFEGHSNFVTSATISPDERYLVTGSYDTTARLWELETGHEIRRFGGYSGTVGSVAVIPDNRYVVTGNQRGTAQLWEVETGREVRRFEGHSQRIESLAVTSSGRYLVTGSWDKTARLWELETGREVRRFEGHSESVSSVALTLDGRYLVTGSWDRTARLWELENGREVRRFEGHTGVIQSVAVTPDSRYMWTAGGGSPTRLWSVETGQELCQIIPFRDGTWAVTDPAGRYDASNNGDVEGLHWVAGNESIALSQLKNRYYEPGLLAKIIKGQPLRQVARFDRVKLFPNIQYDAPAANSAQLNLTLTNRGGGIGKVRVLVNGKEIVADARPNNFDPNVPQAELSVDLSAAPLQTGAPNRIEVVAWNAEDYLSSRVVTRAWNADALLASRGVKPLNAGATTATTKAPELYAIVGGVSTYASDSLNLRYAAKDAEDMAQALQLGAKRLFGTDKVHLTVLSSSGKPGTIAATKENFKKAFEFARRAKPEDVLVVYLAGHGIAMRLTGDDDLYCYLTQEARRIELSDPAVRAASSITSEEMVEWIKQIPALKQVMVLDTCAAGAAVGRLTESRNLSGEQIRAIDRLKDRTGFHVLMGAAADKVSYEATQYSQGLLTYALLEGMKGAALRSDDIVDDVKLFQYAANRVPELARTIKLGGIQEPRIAAPKGAEGFYIGQMKLEDKTAISLAKSRPLILRPNFLDPQERFDTLELTTLVRQQLDLASYAAARGGTTEAGVVYVDADELPTAYLPVGTYRIEGNAVKITVDLRQDKQRVASFEVSGAKDKAAELAAEIVRQITQALQKQ